MSKLFKIGSNFGEISSISIVLTLILCPLKNKKARLFLIDGVNNIEIQVLNIKYQL